MRPNFKEVSLKELRDYILKCHENEDASEAEYLLFRIPAMERSIQEIKNDKYHAYLQEITIT